MHLTNFRALTLLIVFSTVACSDRSQASNGAESTAAALAGGASQEVVALFLPLSAADSSGLPRRTLDTMSIEIRPGLKADVEVVPHTGASQDLHQYVRPNLSVLRQAERSQAVSLALASGQTLIADLVATPGDLQGATVWTGSIRGSTTGRLTMVRIGDVISGKIDISDSVFSIGYVGNGVHVIERKLQQTYPQELTPRRQTPPVSKARPDVPPLSSCAPQTLDVLVVLTRPVMKAFGGYDAARTVVELARVETDTAFQHSGIQHRLRLVGVDSTTYADEGNIDTDLDRLHEPADNQLDDVILSRDKLKADVVSLWVRSTDRGRSACGLGYVIDQPALGAADAFFVVRSDCATGYYSFGHELGHNLGVEHDRVNASVKTALPYAYGYQDPDNGFRDVMAYNCKGGCERVQFYSTTSPSAAAKSDRYVSGKSLGVRWEDDPKKSADAARAINLTACEIYKYRN